VLEEHNAAGFKCYFDPDKADYTSDLDELEDRRIEAYLEDRYGPSVFRDRNIDDGSEEWQEGRRVVAPVYVWGTTPSSWSGLQINDLDDAEELAQRFGDDILSGSLDDHHEDAFEDIVDIEELYAIVDEALRTWGLEDRKANEVLAEDVFSDRCKSLLEDQAFQSKLAAWNAKQKIIS
jgi:hypothetical protein